MKRNRFLGGLLALVAAPMLSFTTHKKKRPNKGFKIKAGEGRIHGHLTLKGVNSNVLDVKISGSDTEGDLAIFEQTSLSPGKGTPLHVHPSQDEIFYVLEGNYRFKVGDDLFELATGESIFLPRTVPHAWSQLSKTGRMMVVLQPAGKLENFFVTMATMTHAPTQQEIADTFAENEMKVLGPPLVIE